MPSEETADLEERADRAPSNDTPGTSDHGEPAGEGDLSSDEERAIEERLRYLGYID